MVFDPTVEEFSKSAQNIEDCDLSFIYFFG